MVSNIHAIELWLSVRWCVAVRRCEGAKIAGEAARYGVFSEVCSDSYGDK